MSRNNKKHKPKAKSKRSYQDIEDEWFSNRLEEYSIALKERNPPEETDTVDVSSNTAPDPIDVVSHDCATVGCKKKLMKDCIHKMCLSCCFEMPSLPLCYGHASAIQKMKDDERYIDEALMTKKPKIARYHRFEEKFSTFGQTVVVWCQKDFNQNKKFNADMFRQCQREEDRVKCMKKRKQLVDLSTSTNHVGNGSTVNDIASAPNGVKIKIEIGEEIKIDNIVGKEVENGCEGVSEGDVFNENVNVVEDGSRSSSSSSVEVKVERVGRGKRKLDRSNAGVSTSSSTHTHNREQENSQESSSATRRSKKASTGKKLKVENNRITFQRADLKPKAANRTKKILEHWAMKASECETEDTAHLIQQFRP